MKKEKYSKNQMTFIRKCKRAGLKVYYTYSGRFMYGRTCPAVDIDNLSDFPGNPYKYRVDNMGLGWVVYAPD